MNHLSRLSTYATEPNAPAANPGLRPHWLRGSLAARIEGWLTSAVSGRAVSAIIAGSTELGCRSVIDAAIDRASQLGFSVVRTSGGAPDVPGLVWSQLLRELGADEADVSLDSSGVNAVRRGLRDAARATAPVLLVFEDAHRYEPIDLALVEDLLRAPPAEHFALLVGLDPGPGPSSGLQEHHWRFLDVALTAPCCDRLELLPLTMAETAEALEADATMASAPARFATDLHQFCAGVPEYIERLLEHIGTLDGPTRGLLLTGSLALRGMPFTARHAAVLHRRLSGLSDHAQFVLTALGVWSRPATLAQVQSLTGLTEGVLDEAIGGLEALSALSARSDGPLIMVEPARPVEAWALAHTASRLRQQQLRDAAARLARELLAGGLPGSVGSAYHLPAGSPPLTEVDIEYVIAAARRLIGRSRYASAHGLLLLLRQRIEDADADARPPSEVLVMLAETASRLGDSSMAERLLASELGREIEGPSVAASRRLARDLISQGRDADAIEIYTSLLTEPRISARTRAEIELDSATAYSGSAESSNAAQAYERVARLAEAAGATDLVAEALVRRGAMLAAAAEPRSALGAFRRGHTLARRSGEQRIVARSLAGIGLAIWQARPLERAARWLRRAMLEAERCGDMATVSWSAQALFDVALEVGDHQLASQMANLSIEIDSGLHRPRSLAASVARARLLSAIHGESALDRPATDGQDSAPGDANREQILRAMVRSEELQLAGGIAAARVVLDDVRRALAGTHLLAPMMVDLLPRQAAVCATMNDATSLGAVIDDFDELSHHAPGQMPVLEPIRALMIAQLAAVRGEWNAAATGSRESADAFGQLHWKWRRAGALLHAGECGARTEERDQAILDLRAAHSLYRQMGIASGIERSRAGLRGLGTRARRDDHGSGYLTPRQMEIATLAARSMSDAQIASELVISVRTVNTHMHQILARLGLHSRTEIQQRLERSSTKPGAEADGWTEQTDAHA